MGIRQAVLIFFVLERRRIATRNSVSNTSKASQDWCTVDIK